MSEELKDITGTIMNKIHGGEIKMRSRVYFVIGSIFTFIGLVASMLISVFLVGLIRFSLRSHGPMGEYRWEQLLSSFPWWAVIVAVLGLVIGIWLLRQYDFSYKMNFMVIAVGFILSIFVAGFIIDSMGLNDRLLHRGPMQKMMRHYSDESKPPFGPGTGGGLKNNR